eukprot:925381-Pyramimonas_sp.AAC.1
MLAAAKHAGALRDSQIHLGLDTAIKPLLSHSTTGEFSSSPNYTTPCAAMASAILRKPAMFAPSA